MKHFNFLELEEAIDHASRIARGLGGRADRQIKNQVEAEIHTKDAISSARIEEIVKAGLGIKESGGPLYVQFKTLIKAHGHEPGSFTRVVKRDLESAVRDSFKGDERKTEKFLSRIKSMFGGE